MLQSSYFVFIHEFKRRIYIILVVTFFMFIVTFLYNFSFIYQLINYNYLLNFKVKSTHSNYVYYSAMVNPIYYSGFFFYPEQEYNFNISELYSTIYIIEFLFFFIMLIPYILYQFVLFIIPALYSFEKKYYTFIIKFIFIILVFDAIISVSISNYLISFSSTQLISATNNAYYTTFNLISLYSYYISMFIGGLTIKLSIYLFYKAWISNLSTLVKLINNFKLINIFRCVIIALITLIYFYVPVHVAVILLILHLVFFESCIIMRVNLLLLKVNSHYYY